MENKAIDLCISLDDKKPGVHIIQPSLGVHQEDEEGRELWWFGSDPPGGIPSPKIFVNAIQTNQVREIPPPWAAVVKGTGSEGIWICTDAIGLHHLFMRKCNGSIIVGPDALKIAAFAPVHLDPIGAYELICRGNPQGGRTLFTEVECLPPATFIQVDSDVKRTRYWAPPDPAPVDPTSAIDIYTQAVKEAVVRHWHEGDAQELTGGRDSFMVLMALLSERLPVRSWTHGFHHDDDDMAGAQARASALGVPHQAIYLELLQTLDEEEIIRLVKTYLRASSAMANAIEYWHLAWIYERVDSLGSITGVGGEVFRGFYYQWAGKDRIPRWLAKWFLLHGKIREMMPFASPIIKSNISNKGDKAIKEDLISALRPGPYYWHSLDVYYLMHRMHYFAATTFSAVAQWKKVRTPLFDPRVIDCLALIPIELRDWSSGLVRETTQRMLKHHPENKFNYSTERQSHRLIRLLKRTRQLRGTAFTGYAAVLAERALRAKDLVKLLNLDKMFTRDLYDHKEFNRFMEKIKNGYPTPIPIGAVLTIELAAREVGSLFKGIDKDALHPD